jgi:hypothetical protein
MPSPKDERAAADDDTLETEPLSDKRLSLIELDSLLNRPPSWRKRLLYSGLVIAALVVALTALWRALPAASDGPLVTSLLESNVSYGAVTVNGQTQSAPPPLRIMLHTNTANTITLNAPPFFSQTCHITTLKALDNPDHCLLSLGQLDAMQVNNGSVRPDALISIAFTMNDLPPAARYEAFDAIDQAIITPQRTTVPSGSYVVSSISPTQEITSQRAIVPLTASALFTTDVISSPYESSLFCNMPICPWFLDPRQGSNSSGQFWSVIFSTSLRWYFTNASGETVGDVTLPGTVSVQLLLSYHDATGWQISQQGVFGSEGEQLNRSVCTFGLAMLGIQLAEQAQNIQIAHDRGIEGCELQAKTTQEKQGLFLWRFGVLLAADDGAHAMQPTLPIAPQEEIAAVGG